MENVIRITIDGDDANRHPCRLVEKLNNQNGKMIYHFHDELSGSNFSLCKHGSGWRLLTGELPQKDCIRKIGDYLDGIDQH
ncbi:hypothetical protein FO440_14980 [Mucilaginibacter corticis]|uniref:Uncharacterized protein n=1 Tax=Mucilaginibacter corticis TaxID=2597670 RepID=A0A556MMD7_9SPHI|nr:hypothetical protein [Mucilaginibacter corticis]TSJ41035.1 hypothetical protein FO440_14980 [Mucilaginibacter corticis]